MVLERESPWSLCFLEARLALRPPPVLILMPVGTSGLRSKGTKRSVSGPGQRSRSREAEIGYKTSFSEISLEGYDKF